MQEDVQIAKRLLGDTKHFCPVVLKNYNVLRPCTDKIAAKYREKTFYFSSPDARNSFLHNPVQFVAQTKPLQVQADRKTERRSCIIVTWAGILSHVSLLSFCCQPPALRIFLLGVRGSGKSTVGGWLAQRLGLFHVQFREQLQMLIMAKTKKMIPSADEGMFVMEESKDPEVLIKEAMMEGDQQVVADNSESMIDTKVSLSSIFSSSTTLLVQLDRL